MGQRKSTSLDKFRAKGSINSTTKPPNLSLGTCFDPNVSHLHHCISEIPIERCCFLRSSIRVNYLPGFWVIIEPSIRSITAAPSLMLRMISASNTFCVDQSRGIRTFTSPLMGHLAFSFGRKPGLMAGSDPPPGVKL
ncbi:hypothetical protein V6N13_073289 [Hibiscus sabdariffa]|uniref:Uncharacterized protein n=1 Tax=Hibiscus sabdariffa TaxID=183260 RepID=A0ABR2E8N2_9ROSI